ncbi:MAG: PKD-like domain-containing protein [Bacteroidales bacterium]
MTPYFDGGCAGTPVVPEITVNPTAHVIDPVDQELCNGSAKAAVNFTTNNTGGVVTYDWTNDTPSIGLAEQGQATSSSFTATNAGTAPVTATIEVTPYFDGGCAGATESFTITVNPTAQVNDPGIRSCANGAATAAVTFTTNTGGVVTYGWTNDDTSID